MRHFKFLLINIVVFASLFFLLSLLFPGQVVTSKTVTIAAGKQVVIEKLNNTAGWKEWNVFAKNSLVKNNSKANSDTLNYSSENKESNTLQSQFYLYENSPNAVLLNWNLVEKLPWYKPWKKFSAMVLSKNIAAAMDSSLNNLKVQIENIK